MTAQTNPPPPGGDPSMEDILASIRRILSEDEPPVPAAEHAAPAPELPAPKHPAPDRENEDPGVLVLDPSMMVEEPTRNAPVENAMNPEAHAEPPHAPEPALAAAQSQPPGAAKAGTAASTLVAPETAAATASSVGHLVRTLSERSVQVHQGGPTIEDVVRDEIRPILKEWLDVNLPPLVERLVRIEIERVVGRAVP